MIFWSVEWKWKWSRSVVSNSTTPWTVAHQAPLSMGFSRQEYWRGLPFPSPGDLPNPEIEPRPPALQADALTSEPPGFWSVEVNNLCNQVYSFSPPHPNPHMISSVAHSSHPFTAETNIHSYFLLFRLLLDLLQQILFLAAILFIPLTSISWVSICVWQGNKIKQSTKHLENNNS